MLKRIKRRHIIPTIAIGGVVAVVFSLGGTPLFETTESFVLFGDVDVTFEQGVQVSSGDIGSNNKLTVEKDALVSGDLFADTIILKKDATINGNASFNTLKAKKDSIILGATSTPVSLPIADIPTIAAFVTGTTSLTFSGEDNQLNAGSFDTITLRKDSRLTLTGGFFNISKLFLNDNATLIFSTTTTVNIKREFKTKQNVSILPGANTQFDDLTINYEGKRDKKDKGGTKPVLFGNNSFLNFKLLAPDADVHIGEQSTVRGQIVANKIRVGKESVVSRKEFFEKESDSAKIVEDQIGLRFIANEIIVLLDENSTNADAEAVAASIGGRITGFIPIPTIYKIEVETTTAEELNAIVDQLRNSGNPLILEVTQNLVD